MAGEIFSTSKTVLGDYKVHLHMHSFWLKLNGALCPYVRVLIQLTLN